MAVETFGEMFKRYLVAQSQGFDTALSVREMMAQMKAKDPVKFSAMLRGALMQLSQDAEADRIARAPYIRECLERNGIVPHWTLDPGLPEAWTAKARQTFGNFNTGSNQSLANARDAVRDWAHQIGAGMLMLVGPVGTGKTHLAHAATHIISDAPTGRRLVYRNEVDLKQELQQGLMEHDERSDAVRTKGALNELEIVPWLILDDMGVAVQTHWWKTTLDRLVDSRWASDTCRTLITTNFTPNDMSPRIVSRLQDRNRSKVVAIDAPDYRVTVGGTLGSD